jgi:cytochrome c556
MSITKISAMAIAGLMALGIVAPIAQDAFVPPATAEEALALRKALMREDGGILRGAGNLTGDDAVAAMQTLLNNYSHIPDLFPEGSIVGDSKALPTIWENWDDFVAIVETGKTAAASGLAAAQTGDTTGYAAALQSLGATCGACHQQFRS